MKHIRETTDRRPAASPFRRLAANHAGRDFVVGDIHGCFGLLERLLSHIGFDEERDRLFSVGDLIDRGPASDRVAEFLDAPWCIAIRGNHEQMLLDAMADPTQRTDAAWLWQLNGGDWFDALDEPARKAIARRVAALPHALEIALDDGRLAGLVHADVVSDSWSRTVALLDGQHDASTLSPLIWQRQRAGAIDRRGRRFSRRISVAVSDIDVIFFGHTPMPAPIACENTRWLDTGAVHGNRLSIAELAVDGEVWSLSATGDRIETGWRRA